MCHSHNHAPLSFSLTSPLSLLPGLVCVLGACGAAWSVGVCRHHHPANRTTAPPPHTHTNIGHTHTHRARHVKAPHRHRGSSRGEVSVYPPIQCKGAHVSQGAKTKAPRRGQDRATRGRRGGEKGGGPLLLPVIQQRGGCQVRVFTQGQASHEGSSLDIHIGKRRRWCQGQSAIDRSRGGRGSGERNVVSPPRRGNVREKADGRWVWSCPLPAGSDVNRGRAGREDVGGRGKLLSTSHSASRKREPTAERGKANE